MLRDTNQQYTVRSDLSIRHISLRGRREVSPTLIRKLEKSVLILGKNALIAVIYGLNFSFKLQFLRVSRRKKPEIFLCGAFLFRVIDDYLLKCPNYKKTPLL